MSEGLVFPGVWDLAPELDHVAGTEHGRSGRLSGPFAPRLLRTASVAAGHLNRVAKADPYPPIVAMCSRPR